MKCPNCVLGDLQLFIGGELRFQTDEQGRPCGTADIHTTGDRFGMRCDTCSAGFGVRGWKNDGAGEVILTELDSSIDIPLDSAATEDPEIEVEPPPPSHRLE
jgi:hypothetical protein